MKKDRTFYLQDGPTLYTGKWAIYRYSQVITLQDKDHAEPFAATLRVVSGKVTALILSAAKDSIVLIKTD